jgi:hypothetical protein
VRLREELRLLFWDVDFDALEAERDVDFVLPRILEFGRLSDIHWLVDVYGFDAIHNFLRTRGHPELSARTLAFWRAYFKAGDEPWEEPRASLKASAARWHA